MKLKRLLSGVLAGAIALSSINFTAFAFESKIGALKLSVTSQNGDEITSTAFDVVDESGSVTLTASTDTAMDYIDSIIITSDFSNTVYEMMFQLSDITIDGTDYEPYNTADIYAGADTNGNAMLALAEYGYSDYYSISNTQLSSDISVSFSYTVSERPEFEYEGWDDCVYISRYNGIGGAVTIPSTLGGLPVVGINDNAFANCKTITSVIIPEGVKVICNRAFSGCSLLSSVSLPSSLKEIESYAFVGTALTSVTVPSNATIGYEALGYDSNYSKIENFKIYCNKYSCAHKYAVDNGFDVDTTMGEFSSFAAEEYYNDGIDVYCKITAYNGFDTDVTVPETLTLDNGTIATVKEIDRYAFQDNTSVVSVSLPATVEEIGYRAFSGCSSLTTVNIPECVTGIYSYAFFGTAMTSVTVSSNATIGDNAFGYGSGNVKTENFKIYCNKYSYAYKYAVDNGFAVDTTMGSFNPFAAEESDNDETTVYCRITAYNGYDANVVVPETITLEDGTIAVVNEIDDYAFRYNKSIVTVSLPATIKEIGYEAFQGCSSLTTVNIPASVTKVGGYAFLGTAITAITVPASVTEIGAQAFGYKDYGNLADTFNITVDKYSIAYAYAKKNAISYTLTGTECNPFVTKVSVDYNNNVVGLELVQYTGDDTNITIPATYDCGEYGTLTLTHIAERAFYNNTTVTSITIPEGVIKIGYGAFDGCSALTSVKLPQTLETIETDAFIGCSLLTGISVPDSVKEISNHAFAYDDNYNVNSDFTITAAMYSAGYVYATINGLKFTTNGNTLSKYLIEKEEHSNVYILSKYRAFDAVVTLPTTVEYNGATVTLTKVGVGAFENNTALVTLTVPEGYTAIQGAAFYGCTALTTVSLPSTMREMYYNAFANTAISEITIPATVSYIYESFSGNIIINGYTNSYAEQYATDNGITFNSLGVLKPGDPGYNLYEDKKYNFSFVGVNGTESETLPDTYISFDLYENPEFTGNAVSYIGSKWDSETQSYLPNTTVEFSSKYEYVDLYVKVSNVPTGYKLSDSCKTIRLESGVTEVITLERIPDAAFTVSVTEDGTGTILKDATVTLSYSSESTDWVKTYIYGVYSATDSKFHFTGISALNEYTLSVNCKGHTLYSNSLSIGAYTNGSNIDVTLVPSKTFMFNFDDAAIANDLYRNLKATLTVGTTVYQLSSGALSSVLYGNLPATLLGKTATLNYTALGYKGTKTLTLALTNNITVEQETEEVSINLINGSTSSAVTGATVSLLDRYSISGDSYETEYYGTENNGVYTFTLPINFFNESHDMYVTFTDGTTLEMYVYGYNYNETTKTMSVTINHPVFVNYMFCDKEGNPLTLDDLSINYTFGYYGRSLCWDNMSYYRTDGMDIAIGQKVTATFSVRGYKAVTDEFTVSSTEEKRIITFEEEEPEDYELCFHVTDAQTGEPIDNAVLYSSSLAEYKDLYTNEDGNLFIQRITDTAEGEHEYIYFSANGYKSYSASVSIVKGDSAEPVTIEVKMEQKSDSVNTEYVSLELLLSDSADESAYTQVRCAVYNEDMQLISTFTGRTNTSTVIRIQKKYLGTQLTLGVDYAAKYKSKAYTIDFATDGQSETLVLESNATKEFTVNVVDTYGNPVVDFFGYLTDNRSGGCYETFVTDADGKATVNVPSGYYRFDQDETKETTKQLITTNGIAYRYLNENDPECTLVVTDRVAVEFTINTSADNYLYNWSTRSSNLLAFVTADGAIYDTISYNWDTSETGKLKLKLFVPAGLIGKTGTLIFNGNELNRYKLTKIDNFTLTMAGGTITAALRGEIDSDGAMYEGTVLVSLPMDYEHTLDSYSVKDGTTEIQGEALEYMEGLRRLYIPESVKYISYNNGCYFATESDPTIIFGKAGSIAEKFADAMNYPFVACDAMPDWVAAPTNVKVVRETEYTTISWTAPAGATRYDIYGVKDGGYSSVRILKGITGTAVGLRNYSTSVYSGYIVIAYNASGNCSKFIAANAVAPVPAAKVNISTLTPVVALTSSTYTGAQIKPTVTFTGLTEGTDFTVAYSNNISVGTATVTITGIGNYTGTKTATFTITAKSISTSTVTAIAAQTYTGSALTPTFTVKDGTTTLVKGTDYTVAYTNNTKKGTATVTITGKGNYTGTKTATFTINAKSISASTVSAIAAQAYKGSAITPAFTVKDGTKTLVKGTDYNVAYANNINKGTATVTITGINNYTGTKTATFTISAKSIYALTVSSIAAQIYTGSALTPIFTVKDGTKVLVKNTDYTVSYTNNKNIGKATVKITGKGNYTGTKTIYFNITPKAVTGLKTSSQTTSAITIKWTKTANITGYEVYRAKGTSTTFSKIKTITSASTVSYKNTGLTAGTDYKYKVRAYKTVSGVKIYGAYSSILSSATKTEAPAISSLTSGSKKITVKWSKISGADGYQIYSATSQSGTYKLSKTLTSGSTKSATISSLKAGKTYYFKMRAYIKVGSVKVYSAYSEVKSQATK